MEVNINFIYQKIVILTLLLIFKSDEFGKKKYTKLNCLPGFWWTLFSPPLDSLKYN